MGESKIAPNKSNASAKDAFQPAAKSALQQNNGSQVSRQGGAAAQPMTAEKVSQFTAPENKTDTPGRAQMSHAMQRGVGNARVGAMMDSTATDEQQESPQQSIEEVKAQIGVTAAIPNNMQAPMSEPTAVSKPADLTEEPAEPSATAESPLKLVGSKKQTSEVSQQQADVEKQKSPSTSKDDQATQITSEKTKSSSPGQQETEIEQNETRKVESLHVPTVKKNKEQEQVVTQTKANGKGTGQPSVKGKENETNEIDPEAKPEVKLGGTPPKQVTEGINKVQTSDKSSDKNNTAVTTGVQKGMASGGGGLPASTGLAASEAPQGGDTGGGEKAKPKLDTSSSKGLLKSIAETPPSATGEAISMATAAIPDIQSNEKTELEASFPQVERPSGVPRLSKKKLLKPTTLEKGKTPESVKETGRKGKPPEVIHTKPATPVPGASISTQVTESAKEESGSWWSRIFNRVRNFIGSLPTRDPGVSTSAGRRPRVDKSGEANPQQNAQQQQASSKEIGARRNQSDAAVTQDFGENDIYPDVPNETLRPSYKPVAPPSDPGRAENTGSQLTGKDSTRFDAKASPWYKSKVNKEQNKQQLEQETYQKKSQQAREDGELRIAEETAKTRSEQEDMQLKARNETGEERQRWKEENRKIQEKFGTQSETKRKETDLKISDKKKTAELEADQKMSDAEAKAETEKRKAEAKARAEKNKTKKKKRSWWDRVKGAVSGVFNAIKKAVNTIFDALRAIVKGIIEVAKKLVRGIIELARMAIVGLIKAYGAILKGLVTIALAAFPEAAAKARAWIDQKVNQSINAVNKAAEALKNVTDAILDFVGKVLDTYLAVMQKIYNAIIDVLKFLIVGMLEIIRFLWNLVVGATNAPGAFPGAVAEEAIGGDPSQPLPNFEVPMGQEKSWAAAMGRDQQQAEKPSTENQPAASKPQAVPAALNNVLTKPELDDSDVAVDPYPAVTFSPELMASIPPMADGQTLELGGAGDNSVSTEDFQASAADATGYSLSQPTSETEQTENNSATTPSTGKAEGIGGGATKPDWRKMSNQQKLDHYLNEMTQETTNAGSEKPQPQQQKAAKPKVDNTPAVLITKTGRLAAAKRLAFMGSQMMTGIKVMWSKYKAWIIGALVAALVAAGVIAFFTGGAGLVVAVDIIMKALIIIFGAVAVYRASGKIWEYVKLAWKGDAVAAGKALAKAFAIIVVEFFLDKILLGMGRVFKRITKGAKATRIGRALSKGAGIVKKAFQPAKRLVKKGIAKITGSKLVVSLRGMVGKGTKKLSNLRKRILDRFGFKRIWLEKRGARTQLWGEFNAKIMLAEMDDQGNPKFREITSADRKFLKNKFGNDLQVGRKFDDGGIVVSDEFSKQARQGKGKKAYDDLNKMETSDIRKVAGKNRPELTNKATLKNANEADDITKSGKRTAKDNQNMEASRQDRSAAIEKRDNPDSYKGMDETQSIDHANKLNKKVIDESELIGEKAVDIHMDQKGAKVEYEGHGSRTVDRVYKKGDTYYVGEAKGGAGSLGGKKTGDDLLDYSQQGTKDYLEKTITDMTKSSDEATRKMGRILNDALESGDLKYILSRQKISTNGTLGEFTVSEFDI